MKNFLVRIYWLFGLANHPNCSNSKSVTHLLKFLLLATFIDNVIMNLIAFNDPTFSTKLAMQYIVFLSASVMVLFAMAPKKQALMDLLKIIQLQSYKNSKSKLNAVLCCVLVLPFIYAFSILATHLLLEQKYLFEFYCYGFQIKNEVAVYSIAFIKLFTFYLLYPTLTNLIAVAYSASCCLCTRFLQQLFSELENTSPKALTLKVEMELLKKRHRIIDMLEMIEATLSTASFLTCAANFVACLTNMSQLLMYLSESKAITLIDISFISGSAVVSTVLIFLNAGEIPIEMEKFSRLMQRRLEQRSLLEVNSKGIRSDCSRKDEQVFVLSGSDFISYRKSTILTWLGTILTYGLLILSIELKTDLS
ncbi:hypothetical protein HNY73_009692 [Argiope bruennichi]|uniref:Uncharacterized protein n=1 Tax=Argiope bruennichi TaxID=94029 RepID=A0A8T0FFU5_ARGBR|nr:hypothetical protein HNY73_009692 [Argiope bruennichi]